MTSVLLPSLPASPMPATAAVPAAGSQAAAGASETAALAAEFAGLLEALVSAGNGTDTSSGLDAADETGSGDPAAEPEGEQKEDDAQASESGEQSAASMLGWGAPLPLVPTPQPVADEGGNAAIDSFGPIGARDGEASTAAEANAAAVESSAVTAGKPVERTDATEPSVAAITLPVGFTLNEDAPVSGMSSQESAGAVEGESETARTDASQMAGSPKISSNTELAFAVRLSPDATPAPRAPELYLAMPHEVRIAATEASDAGAASTPITVSSVPTGTEPATLTSASAEPGAVADIGLTAATADEAAAWGPENKATAPGQGAENAAGSLAGMSRTTPAQAVSRTEDAPEQRHSSDGNGSSAGQTGTLVHAAERTSPAASPQVREVRTEGSGNTPPASQVKVPESELKTPTLREFSVTVPGRATESGTTPQVEVKVVERTGEVQVAVRSADAQLNTSLREDLGHLVSQLTEQGYRTETWHPGASTASGETTPVRTAAASSEPGHEGGDSGNSGRGGSDTAGREGNARRDQRQNQPEWMKALERSLSGAQASARSSLS